MSMHDWSLKSLKHSAQYDRDPEVRKKCKSELDRREAWNEDYFRVYAGDRDSSSTFSITVRDWYSSSKVAVRLCQTRVHDYGDAAFYKKCCHIPRRNQRENASVVTRCDSLPPDAHTIALLDRKQVAAMENLNNSEYEDLAAVRQSMLPAFKAEAQIANQSDAGEIAVATREAVTHA